MFVKLISTVNFGITIEDIKVYLPGRGCNAVIHQDVLSKSKDFVRYRQWIKTEVFEEKPMPFWPFIKKPAAEIPKKESQDPSELLKAIDERMKIINQIDDKLNKLLSMPIQPIVINQSRKIESSLSTDSDELYIPSNLIPKDIDETIKLKDEVIDHSIDDSISALKRLKKKR